MIRFSRLDEIRAKRPLIHCVSNIVSANDCANVALAVGASPMMAQAPEEMAEITARSAATVLNTGTPDSGRFALCRVCGSEARALGQPLVLDPVGIGASSWRLRETEKLLNAARPDILRVNAGEALALCRGGGQEQGVDSTLTADTEARLEIAAELARLVGTNVLLTGSEDIVHDGSRAWLIRGGSAMTGRVTGTGCMLSVLCGVFAAAEPDYAQAAVLASAFWKLCAEHAARESAGRGFGDFRVSLINAAGAIDTAAFAERSSIMRL